MKHLITIALILSVSLFATIETTTAAPAISGSITVKQPDGNELTIRLYGDEFFNYKTTVDHYPIAMNTEGFYHYASATSIGIEISTVVARNPNQRTAADKQFLRSIRPITSEYVISRRNKSPMFQSNTRLRAERALQTKNKAVLPPRALIILAEYQDVKFSIPNPQSEFNSMINTVGYSVDGATGSAVDYFTDNSRGLYNPSFDIVGPVTLPENRAYYGENKSNGDDVRPYNMVIDAAKIAVSSVNMSNYDANNDGQIDMIFVFFAGYNAAESGLKDAIWPHMSSAQCHNEYAGGKLIGLYACTSELKGSQGVNMAGIGIFCHEFSHVLGLDDFYDTNSGVDGKTEELGIVSLMSSGNYNNAGRTPPYLSAIERETLGWLEMSNVNIGQTNYLNPIHENQGYKIPSSKENEYFVLELRDNTKWDEYLTPSAHFGMIVYHVDQSDNVITAGKTAADLWRTNRVNAYSDHPCIRLCNPGGNHYSFYPSSLRTQGSLSTIRDWSKQLIPTNVYDITTINNQTMSFKATNNQISIPMLQINKSSNSAEIRILNVTNTKSIQYIVNDKESSSNLVEYGNSQIFTVKVIITYIDSSDEIIETTFTK